MKRTIEIISIIALLVALAYAVCTYDSSKDYTFHSHTATCAQQGCTFGQ